MKKIKLIQNFKNQATGNLTLQKSMDQVVHLVSKKLDYPTTAVLVLDEDLQSLEMISSYGYGNTKGLRVPLSKGATGYAATCGQPVNIPNVTMDSRYLRGIPKGRSELAIPLKWKGKVLGVLDVESNRLDSFSKEDVKTLKEVASHAAYVIHCKKFGRKLHKENQ